MQSLDSISGQVNERLSRIERLLGSQPGQAEAEARELLDAVPGQQMAILFLGIARRLQGNFVAAIEVLRPLAMQQADAPLVHLQLGLALREAGQGEEAVQALQRAVTLRPEFDDAWLALADLLTSMGQAQAANDAFLQYARYAEQTPLVQAVSAAIKEGRRSDAEATLRNHLQRQATDIVAICMLAELVETDGRVNEAEAYFRECLALAPAYLRARHNYAVVLFRQNRSPEALVEIEKVLAIEPRNLEARKLSAAILVRLREYERSIRVCEEVLAEFPSETTVWTSLGHMLKTVGRRDESVQAYRTAIEQAPDYGEPWWSLANLKTFSFTGDEFQKLQRQAARMDLADTERLHFQFAAGRALEDRGEFARSFQHYAEGNRIRLSRHPYDADDFARHVDCSMELFSAEFFAAREGRGHCAADPIFVLGLPRSGSTLVEQILASHSKVEGTMELTEIPAIASSLDRWSLDNGGKGYPQVLGELDAGALEELGAGYLAQTRGQRHMGTPHFIDKMPNNCGHIALIHLVLPEARIIDVRRHPLACGFSLFKEHFAGGQNFAYRLEDIGRYYHDYVRLMDHFDRVLPGRVHRVIYETLVEDTEAEIRRLLDYCGLEFEQACVDFHRNRRAVSTASSEQVRSPIFRNSLQHWQNYEAWLGPLKAEVEPLLGGAWQGEQ